MDIWAFGLLFVHMHYGSHFNLCVPQGQKAEEDRENLPLHVLLRQLYWFGPFPNKTVEIADEEITKTLASLKRNNLPAQQGMFKVISELELSRKDNEFVRRIMKMDWRDRPSARDLLEDEWWEDEWWEDEWWEDE
ncbi:hypothetical protein J4E85_002934 [Alternaria conjuncta]|uniref:uncharacterized protein n=1 Tax=Alternaria conjuncta TaxID=181017 RepID=UPI00221F672F|nr:uncharacterized protein J4E85_002934 [Alternaria conjuncta]KAI4932536.1 hypothetical protein J4E85_002934 [Alternaria conjuncta]